LLPQTDGGHADDPAERIRALPIEAIRALLPAWRVWGQVMTAIDDNRL
jgi:hypothetical protein